MDWIDVCRQEVASIDDGIANIAEAVRSTGTVSAVVLGRKCQAENLRASEMRIAKLEVHAVQLLGKERYFVSVTRTANLLSTHEFA